MFNLVLLVPKADGFLFDLTRLMFKNHDTVVLPFVEVRNKNTLLQKINRVSAGASGRDGQGRSGPPGALGAAACQNPRPGPRGLLSAHRDRPARPLKHEGRAGRPRASRCAKARISLCGPISK